ADQQKMDQYFSSVREIEERISRAGKQRQQEIPTPDFETPEDVPLDLQEHIRLMYDLMVLAFQTDATRIITFISANEGSNRQDRTVGVNNGHHERSLQRSDAERCDQLSTKDM